MSDSKRGRNLVTLKLTLEQLEMVKNKCPSEQHESVFLIKTLMEFWKEYFVEKYGEDKYNEQYKKACRSMVQCRDDRRKREQEKIKEDKLKLELKRRDIEIREKNITNRETKQEELAEKEPLEIPSETNFEKWLEDTTHMTLSTFKLSSVAERNGLIRQYQKVK